MSSKCMVCGNSLKADILASCNNCGNVTCVECAKLNAGLCRKCWGNLSVFH